MNPAAIAHAVYFGVLKPALALRPGNRVPRPELGRLTHYRHLIGNGLAASFLSLLVLPTLALENAFAFGGFSFTIQLGPPTWLSVAIGVSVCVPVTGWDLYSTRRRLLLGHTAAILQAPASTRERAMWMAVSVVTGVGEEITWRLVQPLAVLAATGNPALSLLGSIIPFGLGHLHSGVSWSLTTMGIAALYHALAVLLPGGLYVAMAVHFLQNAVVGFAGRRLSGMAGMTKAERT